MNRATVRKVFVLGLVVWIVGAVTVALTTRSGQVSNTSVYDVGLLLNGMGAVITVLSWLMALVASAALGRWGWFIVTLILGLFGVIPMMVIYSFFGPTRGWERAPQRPMPVG